MNSRPIPFIPLALIFALGIGFAGYFVGDGIRNRNTSERSVSVKGLCEREVDATVAIWKLSFSVSGNTLPQLQAELQKVTATIKSFLTAQGFPSEELSLLPPSITDTAIQFVSKEQERPKDRYLANAAILLRTEKVALIKPAIGQSQSLIEKGVILSGSGYDNSVQFLFDRLNDIKPEMIEEATQRAREAAEKFAHDSKTSLGPIRRASQGWFNINDRDSGTPERKVVRVIVDIDYLLK